MALKARMSRRQFFLGSAAVAGGVAFGTVIFSKEENPLKKNLQDGDAAITPFVKITPNEITLIVPRADVGQGIMSMQAHLIAEELDIDPNKAILDPGQPHPTYMNAKIASNSLPFHPLDHGFVPKTVKELMESVAKFTGGQFTGGSSSVSDMHERLRYAGACARETLKETVSIKTGISRSQLTTEDGYVILPDGEKLSYQSLAKDAASVEPISEVPLRNPSVWRYLGKPFQRTDIVDKSIGKQSYGVDIDLPGMVYATVRANPGRGGGIGAYDATNALSMRGVFDVVQVTDGIAVIADNTWRAFKAIEAVDVSAWPSPGYPPNSDDMWKILESSYTEENINSRLRDDGNVDEVFSRHEVYQRDYRAPFLAHAALEPLSATVLLEKQRITIWTATQVPHAVRDVAAKLSNLPRENVTLHVLHAGGSFGRRLDHDYVIQAIEIAIQRPNTPVKTIWRREEDMTHDFPRPIHMAKAKGAVSNGRVVGFELDTISPSLSEDWFSRVFIVPPGPDTLLVWGAYDQPYNIANYRVTGYKSPKLVPIGSWRSPGACSNAFFHESFLSELIHQAGADQLYERIRLIDDPISKAVLKKVGEISNWRGDDLGPNRGRGIAFCHSHHVAVAEVIDITQTKNGIRIDDVWVVADCGTVFDPVNAEAQVSGAVIWGLGHAMNCELTYENYAPIQNNFHQFQGMRMNQSPRVHVDILSNNAEVQGLGEPGTSPAAPALANAIFNLTGKRINEMPFNKSVKFV